MLFLHGSFFCLRQNLPEGDICEFALDPGCEIKGFEKLFFVFVLPDPCYIFLVL